MRDESMNWNRFSTLAVLFLLVFSQSTALFHGSANQPIPQNQSGVINLFSNTTASTTLTLSANTVDSTVSIDMERNVTFQSAYFLIEAKDEVASPGQISLDIGSDGSTEWAFEGPGYGDLGHQNVFANNQSYQTMFSTGTVQSSPFMVPFNAGIDSSQMDTDYTSSVPAGLMPIGQISTYEAGDIDNDSRPEIVVLSKMSSITASTSALASIDWSNATGQSTSAWVATCANAESIAIADFDGDNYSDVVVSAPSDDMACVHFTNATTGALGPAQPVNLSSNLIAASAGDINGDGEADIVSIHANGIFSMRTFNQKFGTFAENSTLTITSNNTQSPALLTSLVTGYFNGSQGDYSAVVTDLDGHSTHLYWLNGGITESIYSLDGLEGSIIAGDIDQDGDIDFISSTSQGSVIAENNGTAWATTIQNTLVDLTNASLFDHDGDGVVSLIVPRQSAADGNAMTIEGNLSVFDVNSTAIVATQTMLQPWTNPTDVQGVDLDGDGLLEHVSSAGESSFGLFIGSWETIGIDINRDGQNDLSQQGYAGDSSRGTPPLSIQDTMGISTTLLGPLASSSGFSQHDYGIQLTNISFDFTSMGHGNFNFSSLDIGYDFEFKVETNPFAVGNLSNSMNQLQTAGVGTIVMPLPFVSSKSGVLTLSNLYADFIPGAPNLSLPPTPILSLDELSYQQVSIGWQDLFVFGVDLIEFELFRTAPGVAFDLTSPYAVIGANMTIDSNINPGQSYNYAVRSLHAHGVTSALSERLNVTVPFPAPPDSVQGVSVYDTPNDNGSSLDVTWNSSVESVTHYEIFIETQPFQSVSDLTSVATFSSPFSSSMSATLMMDSNQSSLVDRTDYWVAVIAYDVYGNSSFNISVVGPVQSQNNSLRQSQLSVEMWTSGSSTATSFEISALDSLSLNVTLASGGTGIPYQEVSLTLTAGDFTHPLTGVTDETGVWYAVNVSELTELSAGFSNFIGVATLSIDYQGTVGNSTLQPTEQSTFSMTGIGILRADATFTDQPVQLNQTNSYDVTVALSSELVSQNSYLANALFNWELLDSDGNTSQSGTVEYKGGTLALTGTASQNDSLEITLADNQPWLSLSPSSSFTFTFEAYHDASSGNQTGNETGNQTTLPSFPDATLPGTLSCEPATYAWEETSTDATITCTVSNPNPFEVLLGFSWKVTPTTPPPLSFEPPSVTESGPSLTIAANESIELSFTPVRNGPSDGLFPGLQGVGYVFTLTCTDDGTDRCSAMSSPSATAEGELQWTLLEQQTADDVNDTVTEPETTSGGSTGLVVGIIAVLVLAGAAAAFVVLRPRLDDDDEDWFEEFDEQEEIQAPITKPSRGLDDLKADGSSIDEIEVPAERRPSLFDEVDGHDSYSVDEPEVTFDSEEEYGEDDSTSESDDGITTDENGTEWWEDEEGVWWHREEGWDDWAVWEE